MVFVEQFYRCGKQNGGRTSKDFIELLQSRVNDILKANIYKVKTEMDKRNRFKFIHPHIRKLLNGAEDNHTPSTVKP